MSTNSATPNILLCIADDLGVRRGAGRLVFRKADLAEEHFRFGDHAGDRALTPARAPQARRPAWLWRVRGDFLG